MAGNTEVYNYLLTRPQMHGEEILMQICDPCSALFHKTGTTIGTSLHCKIYTSS